MSRSNRRNGMSVIEIMVVIVILTSGMVGAFNLVFRWQDFANTTENTIQAINIARDGIESVIAIRNSNWLKLSSDYPNCWKVLNYDPRCIGNIGYQIPNGSYTVNNSTNGIWTLSGQTAYALGTNTTYPPFVVYRDANGLITQNPTPAITLACGKQRSVSCYTQFSRELQITNIDADHLLVRSIVRWKEPSDNVPMHLVTLEETLTNWKKNF